jgi:hypothetical protein
MKHSIVVNTFKSTTPVSNVQYAIEHEGYRTEVLDENIIVKVGHMDMQSVFATHEDILEILDEAGVRGAVVTLTTENEG